MLATSREPLRIEGEHVHRLSPLSSARLSSHRLTAAEALGFPGGTAVCRACRGDPGGIRTDRRRRSDRCRDLPQARWNSRWRSSWRLRASDTFGVRGVAAHLDDRFQLLTRGRRTAPPRHRTLRATLDWSYELLSEPERVVLRRLAMFAGGFTEEAASAVVASVEIAASEVVESLANLVTKSLVWSMSAA